MSTVNAILEINEDGSLHLPVPANMKQGKVQVVAELTLVPNDSEQNARWQRALDALDELAARGGIKSIPDPLAWQREMRQERILPGREK